MSALERVRSWLTPARPLPTREVERYSFDAWVQDRMRFGGMSYPLTGFTMSSQRAEVVDNSFAGYIQGAYKANGVVFAVCEARRLLFSEARPSLRRLSTGELFDDPALDILRRPWPGGTARDLLSRMEQDVTGAGTAFIAREGDRLRRLRPDWCEFILSAPPDEAVEADVVGFRYTVGGPLSRGESRLYTVDQVAAWSPIPDPTALFRGMSWLTPVLEEIQSDLAATRHKGKFFTNAATPNLSVSLKETVSQEDFKAFMEAMNASHRGVENAYKTLYLGGGADVKVVGADLKQLDFKVVQGAGETRIAAAGRVPPIIVGLSEGLQAATYSNYGQARRAFGDHWGHPQWASAFGALAAIVDEPADAELFYDARDIAFLREDRRDFADIQATQAGTISTLITAGYEPDSVVKAVLGEDFAQLAHTGRFSVQLLPPTEGEPAEDPAALEEGTPG